MSCLSASQPAVLSVLLSRDNVGFYFLKYSVKLEKSVSNIPTLPFLSKYAGQRRVHAILHLVLCTNKKLDVIL